MRARARGSHLSGPGGGMSLTVVCLTVTVPNSSEMHFVTVASNKIDTSASYMVCRRPFVALFQITPPRPGLFLSALPKFRQDPRKWPVLPMFVVNRPRSGHLRETMVEN